MFELSQLRCFVAVAEELHFGRAAARLNMTQPPLSRQVQILERVLDVVLLERSNRTVKLTPAGKSFLAEARRLLKLAESAALLAKRVANGKAGSINIGFTATSAYSYVPRLVAACRRELPDVEISLKEMVSSDQLKRLDSGEIDIGLLRPPIPRRGLSAFRVMAEPLIAAVPAGHALARGESVALPDLAGEPFIMYAPYEARYFHDLLVELFSRAGLVPNYVQHLAQIHSMLAMVHSGVGVALVPETAVNLRFSGVALRALDLPRHRPAELFFVSRDDNDNPLVPIVTALAREIAETSETIQRLDRSIQ
ncbi:MULTISPECIES: LysR substrate-binding domain-containing protein [unclassified Bosea (in: a-proteobacteria)]|uniref:LysR substrate-binding domain-containing protein n=1 Tax=unclassified Bosea (in: a-proteobacteria) TaxID=2653178 RepID=UPI000F75309C|nr:MULTISPECIES: LysR substrate-binding domain-containing protein [unclassified Bosea (in: a-proteobacteria)]AZO80985.1 LysR family transcriptional regulator [Bosea sp. Tri-49]RXT25952.1 LysR family transcriptional regulator [Bosea sp. Tri-39]RXT31194.1 LysR family transcriptional regulator [Bosea sp. Tri-54]